MPARTQSSVFTRLISRTMNDECSIGRKGPDSLIG
jgi:hypothetical protein